MKIISKIFEDIADVALPRTCLLCGKPLPREERFVCLRCFHSLPRVKRTSNGMTIPEERLAGLVPFRHADALLHYSPDSDVAQLVACFKYRHCPDLARMLGTRLAHEIADSGFFNGIDCVMPVPLHFTKLIRRTYNQSEYLARGIADATGLPLSKLLKATRPHRSQTSLSHDDRRRNTIGIFRLRNPGSLAGKHVLLVDDVFTTGATIYSSALAILRCQPDVELSFLTLGLTSRD